MKEILILSIVCASISTTVTEMHIFETFRDIVAYYSKWLGKLVHCGYCFSHWTAFFLVAIYKPRLFFSNITLLDYFLTAIAISWCASMQWVILTLLLKGKE